MVKIGKTDIRQRIATARSRRGNPRSRAERGVRLEQFEFPNGLAERLERVAAAQGVKKTDIVRGATESALDALEAQR